MDSPQQLDILAADQPPVSDGWLGTVDEFLELPVQTWLDQMASRHWQRYRQQPTRTQQQAWQDTAAVLSDALGKPHQLGWVLIFEYELPREGGRRPDLLLLAGETVRVLEFKQRSAIAAADLDQTAAYARDLSAYHPWCHRRLVTPFIYTSPSASSIGQWRWL